MKTLTRTIMISLLVGVTGFALMTSPATSQDSQPLDGVEIAMGNANWLSALPSTMVHKVLLEELGAEVSTDTFGSVGLAYESISLGDLDAWANGWFPLHNPQLPDDFNGTVFEAHCPGCTTEGYLINNAAIEEFEITSLEDFRGNEELKQAFDENGDGKADLFGCPPGWGCGGVITDHFELYDWFGETFNHVDSGYFPGFATARARIQNGNPALYYTWRPNDTIRFLTPGEDVQYVNIVENAEDLKKADAYEGLDTEVLQASLGDEAVTDPVNLGWAAGDIRSAMNAEFMENNPAAVELFRQIQTDLTWINEATVEIRELDRDAEQLAEDWVEDNRDKVDEWLNAARNAASGMN